MTEWKVPVFEQGDAEDWVKWRIAYENLVEAYPLDTAEKQVKMLRTLLKGEAKDRFNTTYAASQASTDAAKLTSAINKVAKKSFNDDTNEWRRQRRYMCYHLYFAQGQFQDFKVRLLELNRYLKYFPVLENKKTITCLPDNKLIEIIDKAKPVPYQQALLTSNYDPYCKSMEEYSQYLEKLEASAKIDKVLTKSSQAETTKKSAKKCKKDKEEKSAEESEVQKCKICKRKGHTSENCYENPKNASKVPGWYKSNKAKAAAKQKEITFSAEQFNYMVNHLPMFGKASKRVKKRKISRDDSSEEEEKVNLMSKMKETIELSSSDESSTEYSNVLSHKRKKQESQHSSNKKLKNEHPTCEVVGELTNRKGDIVPARILLDTGTSSTIIL